MSGIGLAEFLLILVVALIVIGPEKLPEVARALAKAYNELRRAGTEISRSIREVELKEPGGRDRPREENPSAVIGPEEPPFIEETPGKPPENKAT